MHPTQPQRRHAPNGACRPVVRATALYSAVVLVAGLLLTVTASSPAAAGAFSIRYVTSQVGGFSVNDRGDVAYVAGGGTVRVTHANGTTTTAGPGGTPELSGSGLLVFLDSDDPFRRASTLTLLNADGQILRQLHSGDAIAGGGTLGGFPAGFGNVDVNDDGVVAFSNLAGGVFTNSGSATQPAIVQGGLLSGGAVVTNFCGLAGIDGNGYATAVVDASDGRFVLAQQTSSGIGAVVRDGDGTPLGGSFGREFGCSTVLAHATNDAGQVAFPSNVIGGSSPGGIFLSTPGSGIATVMALGAPSPVGGLFAGYAQSAVALNDAGQVSFKGYVSGGSVSTGLFVASEGEVCTVVAPGDSAPDGGIFTDVGSGDVGTTMANGFVAFRASTTVSSNALFVAEVPVSGACRRFHFQGFFAPLDNAPTVNLVTGGQAVPVRFSLGGDFGLSVFAPGFPASRPVTCDLNAPLAPLEETVAAGTSSLSYSDGSGQYLYVWKTQSDWGGTCRELLLTFADGSQQDALFKFR